MCWSSWKSCASSWWRWSDWELNSPLTPEEKHTCDDIKEKRFKKSHFDAPTVLFFFSPGRCCTEVRSTSPGCRGISHCPCPHWLRQLFWCTSPATTEQNEQLEKEKIKHMFSNLTDWQSDRTFISLDLARSRTPWTAFTSGLFSWSNRWLKRDMCLFQWISSARGPRSSSSFLSCSLSTITCTKKDTLYFDHR